MEFGKLSGRSRVQRARGRSFEPVRPRFRCASALLQRLRSPGWSTESATALPASDGTRAGGDGEAGRPASPDDDLFSLRRSRYAAEPIFAAIVKNESDRVGQALQRRRLRPSLAVGTRNLGTVRDVPASRSLDDGGELVSHVPSWLLSYGFPTGPTSRCRQRVRPGRAMDDRPHGATARAKSGLSPPSESFTNIARRCWNSPSLRKPPRYRART